MQPATRRMLCCAQGSDWNAQVKLGNAEFVGINYLQSVTPTLALGGEAFWLGQQRKSGAGFAARLADEQQVATAQVATTGLVSLTYLRRISEKVTPRMLVCCCHALHACAFAPLCSYSCCRGMLYAFLRAREDVGCMASTAQPRVPCV